MAPPCSGFAREDFGEIRHHGGVSPAWPISYDEMEPYYRRPRTYTTSTGRGVRTLRTCRDALIPHPAVSHEPRMQQLSDDFARLGLKPFHTPLGVMLDEENQRSSKCIRCGTCDGILV